MMEESTSVVHRFYVIKFIESPNVDIEEYVCVPESWVILVLLYGCLGRWVQVAYPSGESRETTSDRVKREEEPWDEWNIYRAVVTYMTDSYDSARAWIKFSGSNIRSALDYVATVNAKVLDSTSSSGPRGCSNRSSPSSSHKSNLRMQVPSIKINPSIEDQNFYKKQVVKVEVAGRSDDVSDLMMNHPKISANSDDIDGYATTVNQEIPNASNLSCRYEPSGKKLLSSVIQGEQDGMNHSMIHHAAAPRGHLHSSSSSSVDQNHLAQEITKHRQSTGVLFPSLESSKQGPFDSDFWKKQERVFKYISDDSRSYITGKKVIGTPLTAKISSISTKQCHLPLSLPNGIMNGRNKENVSLEIQRQVIQNGIPSNKKYEVIHKKKYSQKMRNKKRRPSVSNRDFKYYVVQFKDLPNPKMRMYNYVCVLKSWITSGLADIDVDNVPDMNFEVKVAYPADPREISLDFRKRPDDPLKQWKSYRAEVKYITGAYYAAKYWIEQKMGKTRATVNNNAADMGENRPTAAPDNSSGSSGGSSSNLPLSDFRKFEVALAHCTSQPGLTVKKICKRPATSAIVDNKKRPKRVEESTAVYNVSRIADRKLKKPIQSKQNRSCLGGQSKLGKAYYPISQAFMSALRTNSQQITPQTQADLDQRDFYQCEDNNRFAAQNIYSTHEVPGHPHMWPNGSSHIPAYQGYTYQNPQSNPVNNNCDSNYIAYLQNGRNLNSAYHCSRIAQSAPDNLHLFDPREHSQDRPYINAQGINETNKPIPISAHVTNNNSTSCCLLCKGNPSQTSSYMYDLVNRLKIALLKKQINKRRPPEHRYE